MQLLATGDSSAHVTSFGVQVAAVVLEELLQACKAERASFEVSESEYIFGACHRMQRQVGGFNDKQPWAYPCCTVLVQIAAVVSQPGKPKGRGNKAVPIPSPVEQLARQHCVPDNMILCPKSAKEVRMSSRQVVAAARAMMLEQIQQSTLQGELSD